MLRVPPEDPPAGAARESRPVLLAERRRMRALAVLGVGLTVDALFASHDLDLGIDGGPVTDLVSCKEETLG